VLALLLRVAGVRLTPPALLEVDFVDAEAALSAYPPEARHIEVARSDGTALRGVFAPAHDGAPVVLVLQEASASAGATRLGWGKLAWQLRDLGFATLVVDYAGVGLSAGERDVRNLLEDARTMWAEALARAGGDPQRVVLRASSLGTIAARAAPAGRRAARRGRRDRARARGHGRRAVREHVLREPGRVAGGLLLRADRGRRRARRACCGARTLPVLSASLAATELDAFLRRTRTSSHGSVSRILIKHPARPGSARVQARGRLQRAPRRRASQAPAVLTGGAAAALARARVFSSYFLLLSYLYLLLCSVII
jgi:hypothetical protein